MDLEKIFSTTSEYGNPRSKKRRQKREIGWIWIDTAWSLSQKYTSGWPIFGFNAKKTAHFINTYVCVCVRVVFYTHAHHCQYSTQAWESRPSNAFHFVKLNPQRFCLPFTAANQVSSPLRSHRFPAVHRGPAQTATSIHESLHISHHNALQRAHKKHDSRWETWPR